MSRPARPALPNASRAIKAREAAAREAPNGKAAENAISPGKRAREPEVETERFIVRCPGIFWLSKKDIARILQKHKNLPSYSHLHKIVRWDYFFVNFPADDAAAARTVLEQIKHRGNAFKVSIAEHPSAKRQRTNAAISAAAAARTAPRRATTSDEPAKCPTAGSATAPWADVPYAIQTSRKRKLWTKALAKVANRMRSDALVASETGWLRELPPGAPVCALERTEFCAGASNGRDYYRNKSEFTVGMSIETCGVEGHIHAAAPTIGYSLGLIREGEFRVGAVTPQCRTTPVTAREVAAALTDVVRDSGQPPYDRLGHTGYWRVVTVRTSARTHQALVVVLVSRGGARPSMKDKVLSDEQCAQATAEALRDLFGSDDRFGLFWQSSDDLSPTIARVPVEHVCGLASLTEEMLGLKFRVHPNSFFQVNTLMAERLYSVIADFALADAGTTVLDVCCGTGTIGLSLARTAHSVVGLDISEPAIADAEMNAWLNGIENARFIAGPAEKVIQEAIKGLADDRTCIAVLDPPRAGVANSVIGAVRGSRRIRRVVYVCCEPANLWRNMVSLCRPTSNAFRGDPFRPIRAAGVDMFAHTPRGEMVVLLER